MRPSSTTNPKTALSTQFIDAYAHCGLSKYKPLPEVERAMRRANVDRAVLVQHLGEFDNRYLEQVVMSNPGKFAGVFLVDPAHPQALAQLERWTETGVLGGIRLELDSLAANAALWKRSAELKLNLVVYCPRDLTITNRANSLESFIEQHRETTIVLSHFGLGYPRRPDGFAGHHAVFRLGKYENVCFQVSGMHMFCEYPYEPMRELVSRALESFGPDRMLWGGNYPVVGSNEDYARDVDLVRTGDFVIPAENIGKVTHDTAGRIWFSEESK